MPNKIIIANVAVNQDESGRFCLNDLHRASGGATKHQPAQFLRLDSTQGLAQELSDMGNPISVLRGGIDQGTFVARELVYAYAMWISAKFHLEVIRTFDGIVTAPATPAVPMNFAEALRLAADQADQIERQQAALALAAPKVEFVERYVESTGLKGFREVCKLLKANEERFREFLTESRIMYRLGGVLTAHAPHIDAGRFAVTTGTSDVSGHAYTSARFTAKGIEWVAGEWAKFNLRNGGGLA